MKRADLFATIAAALPLGALAVVRVPEKPDAPPMKNPHGDQNDAPRDRWIIVHPGDGVRRLPRHHRIGEPCGICIETGVPVLL